jgi:hypothetical protein
MKLSAISVAAAALLASNVAAFASEDSGTITAINWGIGTITLDNGHVYIVPPSLQAEVSLSTGDKVKVTYEDKIVAAISKQS